MGGGSTYPGGKDGLVVDVVLYPRHEVLDILRRRHLRRLPELA